MNLKQVVKKLRLLFPKQQSIKYGNTWGLKKTDICHKNLELDNPHEFFEPTSPITNKFKK